MNKNIDDKKYKEEVKNKWENTKEYQEYSKKYSSGISKEKSEELTKEMNLIFKEFSNLMINKVNIKSDLVKNQVNKLQNFITNNFYKCSNEILLELGKMYISDERFKKNIDIHAIGTAEYVNEAIKEYCY